MGLDVSTFVLELVNFLVLVWILKRFFYRPVLEVIARRRAAIEQSLAEAQTARTDAQTLKTSYEGRLAAWAEERRRALDSLGQEIDAERAQRRAELAATLDRDRDKAAAAAAQRDADARRRAETLALAAGARFASRLLSRLVGPELEARLIDAALEDLAALPPTRLAELRAADHPPSEQPVVVTTAYPVDADHRARIERALAPLVGDPNTLRFEQDAALMAGLSVRVGGWSLALDLRDELEAFARLGSDG